jgi:putative ABC transport system permease protein
MRWFYKLTLRFRSLFRKSHVERDLSDELRFHLEKLVEEKIAMEMTAKEARYAAQRELGGIEQIKEECRDMRRVNYIEDFVQDIRFGTRMLVRNPGFTWTSLLALAIGIAANTLIFSAYNAIDLRPIQAADPGQVVNIYESGLGVRNEQAFNYPAYVYFRDHSTTFSDLIATTGSALSLGGVNGAAGSPRLHGTPSSLFGIQFFQQMAGGAELTLGAIVSENYFRALGIKPALGRSFTADDTRQHEAVVMLSYDYWRRRFGSDTGLLGKTVNLNGKAFSVIGVTPPNFTGTYPNMLNVWVPVSSLPMLEPDNNLMRDDDIDCCRLYGRLRPGVTREQAQAELTVLAEQMRKSYPAGSEHSKPVTITVAPGSPFSFGERGPVRFIALILMGATCLVLVIACANVAGLQLARSVARQKEIGVRLALGAGRSRLVRQLLTEASVLAILSGAAGLLFSWWTAKGLLATVSSALPPEWGTIALRIDPDIHVFAFTLVVCLAAGILFGLAPALDASKPHLMSVIKEEGAAFGRSLANSKLRNILVGAQVAISMTLLIAAGLLARGSFRAGKINPGFATHHVLGMGIEIPSGLGYGAARRGQIVRELVDRLKTVPGVKSAARGRAPLGGGVREAEVSTASSEEKTNEKAPTVNYGFVSPNYFDLLEIPIVQGRSFTDEEARTGEPVALVSKATARRLWPGLEPIGKRVILDAKRQFHTSDEPFPTWETFRVIGVTGDLSSMWLGKLDEGYFYLPMPPDQWYETMLIKTDGDPNALIPALSDQAGAVDPNVVVFAEALDGLITNNPPFVFSRIAAVVSVVIGLLGLVLASVGIYGMVSIAVAQRTHEVGVRMAMGANSRDVVGLLLRQSMKPVVAGMALGIVASAGTSRLLSALLFGIGALDPLAFCGVSLFLGLVALSASYIPARRATKVDPMVALRYE